MKVLELRASSNDIMSMGRLQRSKYLLKQ